MSEAVFETGISLTEKAEQVRKRSQCIHTHVTHIELCLTNWQGKAVSGSRNEEKESAVSGNQNVRECVLGKREYMEAILVMYSSPNMRDKIKGADVVVSKNHVTFLTNRFSRLISLLTSTIFVWGSNGITAILKYSSVNPISLTDYQF